MGAKQIKTNAMRILNKSKTPYKVNYYECDECKYVSDKSFHIIWAF